jgi:ribosomal-protein-serine acetyltransferase
VKVRFDLGDGVELRSLEPEDAEAVYAVIDANRQRLRRWFAWVDPTVSPAPTREFIERSRASETDVEAIGIWVEGEYAGNIGMRVDAMNNHGELGYWLAKSFEGRGLVTKGCRALIDHGLHELGLHRIEIKAAPDNVRSRAVAERLGFTQEAELREASRFAEGYHDLIVYGLLENEWRPDLTRAVKRTEQPDG